MTLFVLTIRKKLTMLRGRFYKLYGSVTTGEMGLNQLQMALIVPAAFYASVVKVFT